MTALQSVGKAILRIEDPPLLRGEARFVDDIVLPGMLEAAFVRSPHAHAAIRGIDTTAAHQLPGVHAILTLADLRPMVSNVRLPLQFRTANLPPGVTPFVLADRE